MRRDKPSLAPCARLRADHPAIGVDSLQGSRPDRRREKTTPVTGVGRNRTVR
ncbi:MAG: hypothetical protein MZV70_39415 [Desulfobacterales bacterium]|nr:hypothetical protein [Desulfobacterales bacterium]